MNATVGQTTLPDATCRRPSRTDVDGTDCKAWRAEFIARQHQMMAAMNRGRDGAGFYER